MPFGIVPDGSEFFIEVDGGSIPFEYLEIDPFIPALFGELCNDSYHCFTQAVAAEIFGDENVLEVISALSAEAGKVGIEHRVRDRLSIMKRNKPFDESIIPEHYVEEALLRDLAVVSEILILRKVTHQAYDGGNFVRCGFAYLYVHKKSRARDKFYQARLVFI